MDAHRLTRPSGIVRGPLSVGIALLWSILRSDGMLGSSHQLLIHLIKASNLRPEHSQEPWLLRIFVYFGTEFGSNGRDTIIRYARLSLIVAPVVISVSSVCAG